MSPLRRDWGNLVALVALFGLFVQTLIPLAQVIPLAKNGDGLTGRIVICSAFGIKTIDLATGAEVSDDDGDPDGQTSSNECLVCLTLAIGDNLLSNACEIESTQLSGQSVAFQISPQDIPNIRFLNGTHGARAPPSA